MANAHKRKSHSRRYPKRQDGYRKPGRVSVNGSDVSGEGCLIWIIAIATPLLFLI